MSKKYHVKKELPLGLQPRVIKDNPGNPGCVIFILIFALIFTLGLIVFAKSDQEEPLVYWDGDYYYVLIYEVSEEIHFLIRYDGSEGDPFRIGEEIFEYCQANRIRLPSMKEALKKAEELGAANPVVVYMPRGTILGEE